MAGYKPKEMPIIAETDTEISIHSKEITEGHSGTILTMLTASSAMPVSYTHLTLPTKRIV